MSIPVLWQRRQGRRGAAQAFLIDLQDTLSSHRVRLFIHILDAPERAPPRIVLRFDEERKNVELPPEPGTEPGAHLRDGDRDTGPHKLDIVVELVPLESRDDKVRHLVLVFLPAKVVGDVLDGEVKKIGGIADGDSDGHGPVAGTCSRDAEIDRRKVGLEMPFLGN